MKKTIAFLLVFVLTLAIILPTAFAETTNPSPSESQTTQSPSESPSETASDDKAGQPEIKADSALLIDVKTGTRIIEHEPDKQISPASTTKILTSLLVLEKATDLNKKVTCTSTVMNGLNKESSLLYAKDGLKNGEEMTIKDLLYGMMVVSGNDASNALATEVGGSIEGFVQQMNEKAKELGMDNSKFVNAHGLANEEHYTTANDMAKLTLKALENAKWKDVFTKKSYNLPKTNKHDARELTTTDKLMSNDPDHQKYHYAPVIGGKTGLTGRTGNWNGCIVALAEKDGRQLLCLIFGDHSNDADDRFVLAKTLFEYGFSQPAPVDLKSVLEGQLINQQIENASALDETGGMLELVPDFTTATYAEVSQEIKDAVNSDKLGVSMVPDFSRDFKAPVKKGEVFGTVTFKYNETILGSADLIASREVVVAGEEGAATSASNSPSSPIKQQDNKELFPGGSISPWWWLLLPAVLIVIIVLRVLSVNKRHRSRFKNKRKVYNYRIR